MDIYKYLDKFMKVTKDPTLDAMFFLLEKFDNPQNNLKFLHIAGTNGKGSVCEMLNNILINAGYVVGKFISPCLINFGERITVNNIEITEKETEEILKQMDKYIEEYNESHDIKVKWFEVITTLAIIHYANKKCDFVVLETGLGGELDCTNVVDSIISIITSIGLDHVNILGNTLTDIAKQKAGIIKKNSDTIYLMQEEYPQVLDVIKEKAKFLDTRLHIINKNEITEYSYNDEIQRFTYGKLKNIEVNLKGKIQTYNAAICVKAVEILQMKGYKIKETALRKGLKTVIHRARFEKISSKPEIIYDGAHNEPAIKNLITNIEQYYSKKKKVFIVSILTTKDHGKMITELVKKYEDSEFYFTNGDGQDRYVKSDILKNEAIQNVTTKNPEQFISTNINTAIQKVKTKYIDDKDVIIFVVGSFYVYGKVRKLLPV